MSDEKPMQIIGQVEEVVFPEINTTSIKARIDTGARTSTIWASDFNLENGILKFKLFDKSSKLYTGEELTFTEFETRKVTPSNGISEERYMVKMLVKIAGRKLKARFTLADRSTQKYPVLIGRNILRGKFVVDVKSGNLLKDDKKVKTLKLRESSDN